MSERISCDLCPRKCALLEGQVGFCAARMRKGDEIVSKTYGLLSSLALDPIEKKPLAYFKPGSTILSVGSFGCNMACPFCQNATIAQVKDTKWQSHVHKVSPDVLCDLAWASRRRGNIGVAFTYNEPLVNYEFVLDTAKLVRQAKMETVLVTNGQINPSYLERVLPWISAWNIDLKAFSKDTYQKLGGDLETTLHTITRAQEEAHVEVTTLVVPGISDDPEVFAKEVDFLADLDPNIPLHITRYFPSYHYNAPATPIERLREFEAIARKKLKRVKLENVGF